MNYDSKLLTKEQHTIAIERSKASFPVRELTYYIDGGKDATEYKEKVFTMIERDPEIMVEHFFDMSRPEAREKSTRQIRRVAELRNQFANDPRFKSVLNTIINQYDRSLAMRLYVHDTLFFESIYAQGTSEQFQEWKDKMLKTQCLGCFAMTEMGHSSFLRGLETTATYDSKHDEFVINSPTLTSTKWWIGMSGQIATHTVALCQLVIGDSIKGLHWFIVPLRDPETGRLLPGVTAGDIGAKMGRAGLDNGWIQFSSVRVPRTNMLMKWGQVTREGKYTPPPNQTVVYASLIGERLLVPAAVFDNVGQAVTIAVRYGAVRRQGNNDEQLLYYQSHQYTLMPVIAGVYASLFVYRYIDAYWKESILLSEQGPSEQKEFLRRTTDVHTTTAGLKAFTGWWAVDAMEMCRRSLGGHGYSAYNAIAGLIGDWGVITTGGGDNIVLAQQCARYLIGSLKKVVSGKKVGGSVTYLNNFQQILQTSSYSGSSLRSSSVQVEILQYLAVKLIESAANLLQKSISDGISLEDSWNNNMMQIIEAARAHTWFYVLLQFQRGVSSAPSNLQPILKVLCDLYFLSTLNSMKHHLLELNYFTAEQTRALYQEMLGVCREVREQCVPLVDAWNVPDWILKAPMGKADGDVYRSYFQTILKAPNAVGVVPYWNDVVKPMLQSKL